MSRLLRNTVLGCAAYMGILSLTFAAVPNPPKDLCIEGTKKCAAPAAKGSGVKWHPGHYVLGTQVDKLDTAGIREIGPIDRVVGWEQLVSWAKIEPSRGKYDWSFIDAALAACEANGKRLVIQVLDRSFSGTSSGRLPSYLASEPGGGGGWYVKPTGGVMAKLWLPAIMDRLIALYQEMGKRYDSEPYFEGVFTAESDPGFGTGPSDYSPQAYVAQLYRLNSSLAGDFQHTNRWLSVNFVPTGQAAVAALIANAHDSRVGISGPDAITGSNPDNSDWGTRTLKGMKWSGGSWVSGGKDYRGAIAIAHDVESPELGGKEGGFTVDQIYNQSYNFNGDSHLFWERKDYKVSKGANTDLMWSTDILPYLKKGNKPTRNACPTSYKEGCNPN